MNNYDAYLFDWDGTLARTLENWLKILRDQGEAYGLKATDRQISERFGNWDWALDFGLEPSKLEGFKKEVAAQAEAQNPHVPLYDHALQALQQLRANGKKLALISATLRQTIDIATNHHKVTELFDVIITGDMVKHHKPDPEGLQAALQALEVAPKRALMLGDSDKDLLAAKNAGIDSLLFYPSSHQVFYDLAYLRSIGPRYVITSWQELLDRLQ